MKSQKIQLEDSIVTVEKLPLRRYAEVIGCLQSLPSKIPSLAGSTNDEILKQIPTIIATSLPEAVRMLSIATGLPEEKIQEMGMDDVVKLAIGVYEVNNYYEIYERLKKAVRPPVVEVGVPQKKILSGGQ